LNAAIVYRLKPTELETTLLLKLSHQTFVDKIFRFEATNLFIGCASNPMTLWMSSTGG
jgi:hypothetical protein